MRTVTLFAIIAGITATISGPAMAQDGPALRWADGTPVRCSKPAIPLPARSTPANLKECQRAARAVLKVMMDNLRVTIACREEYVGKLAHIKDAALQRAGEGIRANKAAILGVLGSAEAGGSEQIRKADTLPKCQAYINQAYQFAEMQPEMKGKWWGSN